LEQSDPEQPSETQRIPVQVPLLQSGLLHWPVETTAGPVAVAVCEKDGDVGVPEPVPGRVVVFVEPPADKLSSPKRNDTRRCRGRGERCRAFD
jgi:hypothetical protein